MTSSLVLVGPRFPRDGHPGFCSAEQLLQLTGISGYTGAHVASRLLAEGYRVRG